MRYARKFTVAIGGLCICAVTGLLLVTGANFGPVTAAEIEMSPISGDIEKPRRHFRLRNPADLTPQEAVYVYDIIEDALAVGYKRSGHAVAHAYQGWRRHNTAPYLSVSHGNHYLNNYANLLAQAYGTFEGAGTMPVGAVIAKDSFSVTETRGIVLGPLFIMEKMPAGFSDVTGDWRFTQILPDGTLLGETNGHGAERVEYCIHCHLTAEKHDYLFFVPQEYRTERVK
jgi:hypothetical protein